MDEATFFAKYNSSSGSMQVAGEEIHIAVVRDARKPPMDLEYNRLTLAIEDPKADFNSPRIASDGIYLVREISAFPLAPNKPCVNERLFMDRKRENYKAKGWGTGRWRIWLALEDQDAQRKKRKKAEIAQNASVARGQADYDPGTPPSDILKRTSSIHVDITNNSKRFKDAYDAAPGVSVSSTTPMIFRPVGTLPMLQQPTNSTLATATFLQTQQAIAQAQAQIHAHVQAQQLQVQQQQQQQQQAMLMGQPMMMMMVPRTTSQPQQMQLPPMSVQTPARNASWMLPTMMAAQSQAQQQQQPAQQQQPPQLALHSMGAPTMSWVTPSPLMFPPHPQTRLI